MRCKSQSGDNGRDGKNHLRRDWTILSLELAKLRGGVVQRGEVVDFTARERDLQGAIKRIEQEIMGNAPG